MAEEKENLEATMVLAPSALHRLGQKTPRAMLVCLDPSRLEGGAGCTINLSDRELLVGSGPEAHLLINAPGVAKLHARFFPSGEMWGISNLAKPGGVLVNGVPANETFLKPGDEVTLGPVQYLYNTEHGKNAEPERVSRAFDRDGNGAETIHMQNLADQVAAQQREPRSEAVGATETPASRGPDRSTHPRPGVQAPSRLGLWILVLGLLLAAGLVWRWWR